MLLQVLALLCLSLLAWSEQPSCGHSSWSMRIKIVGGRPARHGEFPWQVSLYNINDLIGHQCGGVIITNRTLLTAAHCFDAGYNISWMEIRYNSLFHANASRVRVAKVIVHPQYDSSTFNNDIAIVHAASPLVLNRTAARAICLPPSGDDLANNTQVTVSGWGYTREDGKEATAELRTVTVPVVDRNTCNDTFKTISNNMICAGFKSGQKDACTGDSGGPLITRDSRNIATLRGLVSSGEGCARPNKFGIYTRVGTFVDRFIKHHLI